MGSSITFYRLLAYLAAGGLAAVALVPAGQVSRGFFRFAALLYAGLFAAACAVRPGGPAGAGAVLFAAAGALALVQALFASRLGTANGRRLLALAAVAAAAGVAASALETRRGAPPGDAALATAAAVLSAALLGSVLSAMILGHWYLVMPRLSPDPLLRLTRLYAASVALRTATVAAAFALLYLTGGRALDRFMDGAGFLIWPRILFGLLGPLFLAGMTLPTVKVRDTQPATGMLYVACVLVLVGEGIAQYLGALTGVPV